MMSHAVFHRICVCEQLCVSLCVCEFVCVCVCVFSLNLRQTIVPPIPIKIHLSFNYLKSHRLRQLNTTVVNCRIYLSWTVHGSNCRIYDSSKSVLDTHFRAKMITNFKFGDAPNKLKNVLLVNK